MKVVESTKVSGDVIQEIEFCCLPFLRMLSNTHFLGESGEKPSEGVDVKSLNFHCLIWLSYCKRSV